VTDGEDAPCARIAKARRRRDCHRQCWSGLSLDFWIAGLDGFFRLLANGGAPTATQPPTAAPT
jgi:hypothetical protein